VDAPPPSRPDVGQHAAPPQPVAKPSGGTAVAVIIGSIVAAILILAIVIVVAVAFVGRSASSQFEHVGDCVTDGNVSCSIDFPSP